MMRQRVCLVALVAAALMLVAGATRAGDEAGEAASQLQFVEDFSGTCTARNATQILMRNTHATRALRVWLDRYVGGVGTGDRSRTDLKPGAEPDPLGCSKSLDGAPQEWRVVRVMFVE